MARLASLLPKEEPLLRRALVILHDIVEEREIKKICLNTRVRRYNKSFGVRDKNVLHFTFQAEQLLDHAHASLT